MTESLAELNHNPDLSVTIRVGTEHFGDGVITLVIRGDGLVAVEQRQAGATTRSEARLATEAVAELGRALDQQRFSAVRPTSPLRLPGDTQLVLEIARGDSPVFRASLWAADRFQDRELDEILRIADATIFDATAGRLGQR